jgi:hypothetical protein
MAVPRRPKTLLLMGLVLAIGGLVLATEARPDNPKLHVPVGIAYVIAAVLIVAGAMAVLQVLGIWRWNDLLAAAALSGMTVELVWLTIGSGQRRCWWGMWQPPEPVCRATIGFVALMCAATAIWAFCRARKRPGT